MELVTDRIFASALDCKHKCFLLLNGHQGPKSEYEKHTEDFDSMYQIAALTRIKAQHSEAGVLHVETITPSVLDHQEQIVVVERTEVSGLRSDSNVLVRAKKNSNSFEPIFFYRYEQVSSREKLLLAYKAAVVGKAWGIMPSQGQIIYGTEFNTANANLLSLIPKVEQIIQDIKKLSDRKDQCLFLCPHCDVCEFLTECRSKAVEEDNMSLIQGMRRKHIEEQKKKGIFTLHQFSYTFRPRKTPKRAKNPSKPRHFALQAQALREKKVYIYGTPELPSAEPSIYFDIEGIPRGCFYYLIGMLTVNNGNETYQFFWADDKSQQVEVFTQFCDSLTKFPAARLFHYGNYDVKALMEMKDSMDNKYSSLISRIVDSCYNVLSVLYPHCYFPLYSNRLRDVARFLGYEFKANDLSGVRSIVFRERWEKTADNAFKDALVAYNREDCEALRIICSFIRKSTELASAYQRVPGRDEEMSLAESLRQVGAGNRPVFRKAEFACPEFELINKCAYFDYQRNHVFARTRLLPKRARSTHAPKTQRRASLSTMVSATCKRCIACESRRISCEKTIQRWLIDLKYFKTGIGVKRWQPCYLIRKYHCRACGRTFLSPDIPFNASSRVIYGQGLICWCVYNNIVGKQPMLQVARSLKDIFGLNIPLDQTYRFKRILASYYRPLYDEICTAILCEKVLFVDETTVKLRRATAYVWVLCSTTKVYYMFRESREGTF